MTVTTTRRAYPGTCPTCGTKTLRGELKTGEVVEVEPRSLRASEELRAFVAGISTYRGIWKNAIQLDPRTPRDIKIRPAGFDGARIYPAHNCTKETQ